MGDAVAFTIFLYQNAQSVDSFRSSLAHPALHVIKTLVDGSPALWRPSLGFDSTSFVSVATNDTLVSVQVSGGPSSVDSVARTVAGLAVRALRSHAG